MDLVIVESPAKAKTINKYLGSNYKVIASFGHVRDLPTKNGSVLPEEDFAMKYEVSEKATKYVSEIIKNAKSASDIILATDPDREGESISWHIAEVLKDRKVVKDASRFKRVAFNEITKKAVLAAMANPREVDSNLVDAQQARRALDYLVGFTLSPLLWRKLPGCRSAGRVQSVALRLICDRENEIERFVSREYWDIELEMIGDAKEKFTARLTHVDGQKLEKFSIEKEDHALKVVSDLNSSDFHVAKVERKTQKRNPPAPFITSSLQQEASRKLGFSAKKTMQVAQKLYEGIDVGGETIGLITYMRTDGVNLSEEAINDIRQVIESNYGDKYLPTAPRIYKSKSKNAQEAHEAIRPTDAKLTPDSLRNNLDADQLKLYSLIWVRSIASQMESVVMDTVTAMLVSNDNKFAARATGSTVVFDGFYKIYREGQDDIQEEKNNLLPPLKEAEALKTEKITPNQHFTEAPPRYSEASLVKKMEELGIGRPSTYASIISVLQDRKYAILEKKRFHPTDLGRLVTVFLVKYFAKYVEYDFTAKLETDLDKIAEGEIAWKKLLGDFWTGFNENVSEVSEYKTGDVIEYVQQSADFYLFGDPADPDYKNKKQCPSCINGVLTLKLGKYGAFLACGNYPDCTFKKQISKSDSDQEMQAADKPEDKVLAEDNTGISIILKKGPYGFYVQLGDSSDKKQKPKRASIPPTIKPEDINLAFAVKLLNMPILIGTHSETAEEMHMGIGKYGPYVKYQGKFVSIPKDIDPFSITPSQAEYVIANKKESSRTKAREKKTPLAKKSSS